MRHPLPLRRIAVGAVLALTLAVTLLRALRSPNEYAEAYWLMDYRFGIVRRGLVGSALSLLTGALGIATSSRLIVAVAALPFAAFLVLLCVAIRQILERHRWSPDAVLIALLFVSSPFVVMAGHLFGYLDSLLYVALLGSILLLRRGRLAAAALVQCLAVLAHESYLLMGYPVACVAALLLAGPGVPRRRLLVPILAPPAVFGALVACQAAFTDSATLSRQLAARLAALDFVRDRAGQVASYQTTGLLDYFRVESPEFARRLLRPRFLVMFGPALLALAWFARARFGRRPGRAVTWLALAAVLAPLAMHAVAWDTSRIWTYPLMSALVMLWVFGMALEPSESRSRVVWLATAALVPNVALSVPLMDALDERFGAAVRLVLYLPALALAAVALARALKTPPTAPGRASCS